MRLTKEMVVDLNNELAVKDCPFRYEFQESVGVGIPSMEITLPNMNYVDSFIINVTREFLEWLELWFKTKYSVELNCNNTGSVFWSKVN